MGSPDIYSSFFVGSVRCVKGTGDTVGTHPTAGALAVRAADPL